MVNVDGDGAAANGPAKPQSIKFEAGRNSACRRAFR
jgi:hypothetical protein